jgi:hypothetical protein
VREYPPPHLLTTRAHIKLHIFKRALIAINYIQSGKTTTWPPRCVSRRSCITFKYTRQVVHVAPPTHAFSLSLGFRRDVYTHRILYVHKQHTWQSHVQKSAVAWSVLSTKGVARINLFEALRTSRLSEIKFRAKCSLCASHYTRRRFINKTRPCLDKRAANKKRNEGNAPKPLMASSREHSLNHSQHMNKETYTHT